MEHLGQVRDRHAVQIAREIPAATERAGDVTGATKLAQGDVDLARRGRQPPPEAPFARLDARAARRHEPGQKTQRQRQARAGAGDGAPARLGRMPLRHGRRDLGAEQCRRPGQVHPDQEHRDRRQRAVDHLVGGEVRQKQAESLLQQLEHERRDQPARQGVPRPHRAVRHHEVQKGETEDGERERKQPREVEQPVPDGPGAEPLDRREGVARKRQGGADEHGTECQHRPIDRESERQRPRLGDPPDGVDRAADVGHEQDRRDRQESEAGSGHPAGVLDEGGQLLAGLGARLRHQGPEHEGLHVAAPGLEGRDPGEHRQTDGEKRHDGQERDVAETGRLERAAIGQVAARRVAEEAAEPSGREGVAPPGDGAPSPAVDPNPCHGPMIIPRSADNDPWRSGRRSVGPTGG